MYFTYGLKLSIYSPQIQMVSVTVSLGSLYQCLITLSGGLGFRFWVFFFCLFVILFFKIQILRFHDQIKNCVRTRYT